MSGKPCLSLDTSEVNLIVVQKSFAPVRSFCAKVIFFFDRIYIYVATQTKHVD